MNQTTNEITPDRFIEETELVMNEFDLQASYVETMTDALVFRKELALLYATPNEGFRGFKAQARRKAEGMKSGIPDLCLPVSRGGFSGLYIEFKAGDNTTKPEQKVIIKMLSLERYLVVVTYSARQAADLTFEYLDNKHLYFEGGDPYFLILRPLKSPKVVLVQENMDELVYMLKERQAINKLKSRKDNRRRRTRFR